MSKTTSDKDPVKDEELDEEVRLSDIDITDEQQMARWCESTLAHARERILADAKKLRDLGIIDEHGNQLRSSPIDSDDPDREPEGPKRKKT